MANLTKQQRQAEEVIKGMIYRAHQRGVCDSDGRSVKNAHGMPIAKPRTGYVTVHKVFPRREYR